MTGNMWRGLQALPHQNNLDLRETPARLSIGPGKMGGRPCIHGMRITVGTLTGLLAGLHNLGQFHGCAINYTLREVLVRPTIFIYGIGVITAVGFYLRMAERECETWRYSQFCSS